MRAIFAKLCLALLSTALFLALLEAAARVAGVTPEPPGNPMFSWKRRGEYWTMKPGSVWSGPNSPHTIRVNGFGLRGQELNPKRPGEFRILFLGDSVTFGYGVEEDEAYPLVIERELRARGMNNVKVINAGVAGWSARQARLFLERWGEALRPDVVILGIVLNDIVELRSGLREIGSAGVLSMNAVTWLAQRSAAVAAGKNLYVTVVDPAGREVDSVEALVYEADTPAVGDAMKLHHTELQRLADAARDQGAQIGLVLFPFTFQLGSDGLDAPQRSTVAFASAAGIPVLDLLPVYRRYEPKAVFIDVDHPTTLGHKRAADEIVAWLDSSSLLR